MVSQSLKTLPGVLSFVTLIGTLAGVGCLRGQLPVASQLEIDKGTYITYWSQNKAKPVIEILGCTATIVSANTIITAAHCVGAVTDSRFEGETVYYQACIDTKEYKSQCTNKIHVPNEFIIRGKNGVDTGKRNFKYDVAVLVFEATPFKSFFKLRERSVEKGMEIIMVGYSEKEMTEKKSSSKRWGINTVAQVDAEENTIGSQLSSGVAISPGDSGGPLLHDCQLVGVASRMLVAKDPKTSLHTNVLVPALRKFLLETTEKGANICGLMAKDEKSCPANQEYRTSEKVKPGEFPCKSESKEGIFY